MFVVVALGVLLSVSPLVTALVYLPVVVVAVIAQRAYGRISAYRQASREATGRVAGALGEMFEAATAVQIAGAEGHVMAHFRRLSDARRQAVLRDVVWARLLDSISANVVSVGTGLVLLAAAGAMRGGSFSVGDFALFTYYLGWVGYFTAVFGRALARYRQAGVSFARLGAVLPVEPRPALVAHRPLHLRPDVAPPRWRGSASALRPAPDTNGGPMGALPDVAGASGGMSRAAVARDAVLTDKGVTARDGASTNVTREEDLRLLEVRGLTYRFAASGRGMAGVDLRIPRGAFVVVTGRIGAGKTTLLRALLGLLPADGGEVRWNGRPVADAARFFVPPRCAYTPQVPRLFSATLRDNILLGLPATDEALHQAVRDAALAPDVAGLAQGVDTLVGTRGVTLSGGQVQRTAAARMLIRQPALLVFDDLSSALDVETEGRLWERVFSEREATVLAVSHGRAVLRRASHVVVLQEGQVEAQGELEALLAGSSPAAPRCSACGPATSPAHTLKKRTPALRIRSHPSCGAHPPPPTPIEGKAVGKKGSCAMTQGDAGRTPGAEEATPERPLLLVEGEKIGLGPHRRELIPLYLRWMNDLETLRTLGVAPVPMTLERETAWYERAAVSESPNFTIYERATWRPIGTTSLMEVSRENRSAEFGILIGEATCRGKGYGTETTRLMLDYAFTALGLHSVMLRVYEFNLAGQRAYSKAGFREFGRRRQSKLMGGRLWDTIYMECLASEFTDSLLAPLLAPDVPRPPQA